MTVPKRYPNIADRIIDRLSTLSQPQTGRQLLTAIQANYGNFYSELRALCDADVLEDTKLGFVLTSWGWHLADMQRSVELTAGAVPPAEDTEPEIHVEWDEGDVDVAKIVAPDDVPAWILFIPDVHRPHHDKAAWALMLKVARNMRKRCPGRFIIVFLGDYLDAYSVSRHSKNPNMMVQFETEIADGNAGFDEVQAVGADETHFIAGNHCHRLARFLAEHAPQVFNMLKVEDLLHLRERGWSYTPYQDTLRIGKLNVTHDLGKAGKAAHEDARDAYEGCAVIGHTHISAVSYKSNLKGEAHVGAMFGWLGDPKKIDYKHQAKAIRDWIHGVGVGVMEPDGVVHLHGVPFVNGKACVFGELIS